MAGVGEKSADFIATFMQQVIVEYHSYGGSYRRSDARESVAIPISIATLDHELQPYGETFQAVTRDMSCGGVGFFHTQPVNGPFLQLIISSPESGDEMKLLARVEHCTPCGGFHIVGCRFVGEEESVADVSVGPRG